MNIPVFHDDQHGTAIISGAGLINALEITGKKAEDFIVVVSGAGAAAIACASSTPNSASIPPISACSTPRASCTRDARI